MEHSKTFLTISWILRGVTAVILLQTLFFKFTGAKESVYIFSTLGLEPWGRIGSGVAELIAAVLMLVPATVAYGAVLSLGVISGAIVSHLTKLGITLPGCRRSRRTLRAGGGGARLLGGGACHAPWGASLPRFVP